MENLSTKNNSSKKQEKTKILALLIFHYLIQCNVPACAQEAKNSTEIIYKNIIFKTREAKENWTEAKEKTKNDLIWKKWLNAQIKDQVEWQSEERDTPEWEAGWLHDYTDSESGRILKWKPYAKKPIPNEKNQRLVAGWIANNRFHNIEKILNAARLYKITKDEKFKIWCEDQINMYAESYNKLSLKNWNGQARLMNQSLDEAQIAIMLLDAARIINTEQISKFNEKWKNSLFIPIANNLIASKFGTHNISIWQNTAIYFIGIDYSIDSLSKYANKETIKILRKGISQDGYWIEDSLAYQDYVIEALNELFIGSSVRDRLSDQGEALLAAEKLLASPFHLRFESGESPSYGDTTPNRKIPNFHLWKKIYRSIQTEEGSDTSKNEPSWETLLDPVKPINDLVSNTYPEAKTKQHHGINSLTLTNKKWHVFSRYGQNKKSHAHQDQFNYELQYEGKWITKDEGTVAYGTKLHNEYYKSDIAHNVPIIDGQGQYPWPSKGNLTILDDTKKIAILENKSYQPNTEIERQFEVSENFKDKITVKTKDNTKKNIGFIFNTNCKVQKSGNIDDKKSSFSLEKNPGFYYWKNLSYYIPPKNEINLKLTCSEQSFSFKITSENPIKAIIATSPSTTENQEKYSIFTETTEKKQSSTFITEIIPNSQE